MADKSGSPAFKPPSEVVTENQPWMERVPMDSVEWGNRRSQQPNMNEKGTGALKHIPNSN